MTTINLKCAECRNQAVIQKSRDTLGAIKAGAEVAYESGWRLSRGKWFCSTRCAVTNSKQEALVSPCS